jgi:hypothetical protein
MLRFPVVLVTNQWAFLGLRENSEQGYGLPLIWDSFSSKNKSLKKSWKSTGNRPPIGFVMGRLEIGDSCVPKIVLILNWAQNSLKFKGGNREKRPFSGYFKLFFAIEKNNQDFNFRLAVTVQTFLP